jgi:arginine-tRNA-protein transferase
MSSTQLALYLTAPHPCGYYAERRTSNLVPDPRIQMDKSLYSLLVSHGFRRSGGLVYRPHCEQCKACVPCRINVARFVANRRLRRCNKRNLDVTTHVRPARLSDEYFELYQRYLNQRHADGNMANPAPEDFTRFLLSDWCPTVFIESRVQGRLIAVAVADFLKDGPSAVYTFFDPDEAVRSPGSFAILQQIWLAQVYGLPHVYLGYWIQGHPKMDYKIRFPGMELLSESGWHPADEAAVSARGLFLEN